MTEHRWSKFWWADWMRDPSLRSCSLAARGLWMDMLAIAFDGAPRGHVTIGGKPATPRQLATIAGIPEKQCVALLAELEEAGVFSRSGAGAIVSRRMVRDTEASEAGREAIARRWKKDGDPNTPPNRGRHSPPHSLEAEAEAEAERTPLAGGSARARARAGTPLPEAWQPVDRAPPPLDHAAVLARFRDWHRAKGTTAADWDAKWRLWLSDEATRPKPPLHTQPPAEQDRRILAAVGLQFDDPKPVPLRIAQ